ncbi:MAG: DUF5103 domain-containing protein [Muribaculaceae bacterium]|nr:DUF5103 domain-containing protein [Muribaculaceae bacterium]
MNITSSRLTATAIFLASLSASAAEYTPADTRTAIFSPDYRTLTIEVEGNRLAPAVLVNGADDRLVIGFDGMGDEREYLRYSIYHCDADWSLSDLVDSEVFDGFNYADIEDYAFSRGTITHYVHYTVTLPNGAFRFRLSGNYLMRVYPENNPDDVLLQARFMVSEGAVSVSGDASSRTDIDYNATHQQIAVNVALGKYPVRDPYNDITLKVIQNGRHDNTATLRHPTRVSGTTLTFEHNPALIFRAGNEYRRMESVSTSYPGMGVDQISFEEPYYHMWLATDRPRLGDPYRFDRTQHGRFFVREYNSTSSDTEADYVPVHFSLDMLQIPDAEVYLDGDFTHRAFDRDSRMDYNPSAGRYEKVMMLKQGAYNYQYVAVPPVFNIEGDFYQTVNEYLVLVYYRAPGERFDRLLGAGVIYSGT